MLPLVCVFDLWGISNDRTLAIAVIVANHGFGCWTNLSLPQQKWSSSVSVGSRKLFSTAEHWKEAGGVGEVGSLDLDGWGAGFGEGLEG